MSSELTVMNSFSFSGFLGNFVKFRWIFWIEAWDTLIDYDTNTLNYTTNSTKLWYVCINNANRFLQINIVFYYYLNFWLSLRSKRYIPVIILELNLFEDYHYYWHFVSWIFNIWCDIAPNLIILSCTYYKGVFIIKDYEQIFKLQ